MTEHFKAPEKIQLSKEEIANLSDALRKVDEKMKAMPRETKENVQEPIVMRRKLGLTSMVWTRRKKETSNQKRMKKQEFGKMRRGLGTSRTSLNVSTSKL